MSRRNVKSIFLIGLLVVVLVAASGCSRPKSTGPLPTQVPKTAVPGTVPAATGMPTPATGPTRAPSGVTPVASPVATAVATPTSRPAPLATVVAPTPTSVPPATTPGTYVVRPGDWLWKIARDNGTTPQAIAAVNPGLDVNVLRPGQTLNLPRPGSGTPPTTPVPSPGQVVHVVKPGENLFRIALKYNKTPQAIATANGLTNLSIIYVGQRLIIP